MEITPIWALGQWTNAGILSVGLDLAHLCIRTRCSRTCCYESYELANWRNECSVGLSEVSRPLPQPSVLVSAHPSRKWIVRYVLSSLVAHVSSRTNRSVNFTSSHLHRVTGKKTPGSVERLQAVRGHERQLSVQFRSAVRLSYFNSKLIHILYFEL